MVMVYENQVLTDKLRKLKFAVTDAINDFGKDLIGKDV